jgi:hypothetical protein
MPGVVDIYVAYRFIKGLTIKWKSWDAYKEGVIDEKGRVIVEPKNRSKKQKKSYGAFNRLIASVKRVFDKVPVVRSRIGSFATALWLLKEEARQNGATDINIEQLFIDQIFEGEFELEDIKEDIECYIIPKGRYHVVDDISETNETIHIVEDVASFGSELGVALFNIHNSTGASIIVSNSNMERV